jgi:hypothetical protein
LKPWFPLTRQTKKLIIVAFAKSQNHINFCNYLALDVRQFVINVSPFNLHRNILVEMLTVSTNWGNLGRKT